MPDPIIDQVKQQFNLQPLGNVSNLGAGSLTATGFEPLNSFDKGLTFGMNQRENRANNQQWLSELYSGGVNLIPNTAGMLVEGIGQLGELFDSTGDYDNDLVKLGKSFKNSWADPIYTKSDLKDQIFSRPVETLTSLGLESLVPSVIGFVAEGYGIGGALSGLSTLSNAGKVANTLNKGLSVISNTKVGANTIKGLTNANNQIATAGLLAYTEGAMSGNEVYKSIYNSELNKNGDTEENRLKAQQKAKLGANTTVGINTIINSALNLTGVSQLFKSPTHIAQARKAILNPTELLELGDDVKNLLQRANNSTILNPDSYKGLIDDAILSEKAALLEGLEGIAKVKMANEVDRELRKSITDSLVQQEGKRLAGNIAGFNEKEAKKALFGQSDNVVKAAGLEALQEGFEEVTNVFAENQGKNRKATDNFYNLLFDMETYGKTLFSGEGLFNFFAGALGGVGTKVLMDATAKLSDKSASEQEKLNAYRDEYNQTVAHYAEGVAKNSFYNQQIKQLQEEWKLGSITPEKYQSKMKELQDAIYYNSALSTALIAGSTPHLLSTFDKTVNTDNTVNLLDNPELSEDDRTTLVNKANELNSTGFITQAMLEGYTDAPTTPTVNNDGYKQEAAKRINEIKEQATKFENYNAIYGDRFHSWKLLNKEIQLNLLKSKQSEVQSAIDTDYSESKLKEEALYNQVYTEANLKGTSELQDKINIQREGIKNNTFPSMEEANKTLSELENNLLKFTPTVDFTFNDKPVNPLNRVIDTLTSEIQELKKPDAVEKSKQEAIKEVELRRKQAEKQKVEKVTAKVEEL